MHRRPFAPWPLAATTIAIALVVMASALGPVVTAQDRQFEGRTISMLINSGYDAPQFHAIEQAFEDATGATVNTSYVPFDGLEAKYAAILAAQDSSIDGIEAVSTHWVSYADALFADMSGLISPDTVPDMTTYAGIGDAVYALPNFLDVHLFYWNKDRFEAAGLDPETAPTSFDEWFAACDELKVAFPDDYCFDWHISNANNTFAYWAILLNAAGGTMYNDDLTQVAFNTPEGLAALQAFQTMTHDKQYVDPASYGLPDQTQPAQRFAQPLTSTLVNWASAYTVSIENPETSNVAGKVGVTIMPGIAGNRSGSMDGWDGFAVNAFSENKDVAAAYADWWASLDMARQISSDFGTLPVRRSLLAETGDSPAAPAFEAAAEQYEHPVNRFPSPFYTPIAEVVDVVLHGIVDGSLDAQAALDKMTADAQAKIDEYWAR